MKLIIVEQDIVKGIGQGRVGYEIARAALLAGIETSLVAISIEQELVEMGASWIPVRPKPWPAFLFTVAEFTRSATRAVKRIACGHDIIHAFGYTLDCPHQVNSSQFVHAAWAKSPCPTFRGRRMIYEFYQWLFTAINSRWERRAYFLAQNIVACSELVREELLTIGMSSDRIHVIGNGIDIVEFQPGFVSRNELGLPEAVTLALFVGDIRTPRKNLDAVLHSLVKVPDLHLAVVGAVENSPYPLLAERLNILSRVYFLGFRRDVNKLMQAADFFVFPSHYEPFGNVVLEAMASGLPVVVAATVGASSTVTPESGIVVANSEGHVSLTAAMQKLADSRTPRLEMGETGRRIAQDHTWRDMAERYLNLYQNVAEGALATIVPLKISERVL